MPPGHPVRETIDRLEGFSCVPALSRALGPPLYSDIRAALLGDVSAEDRKNCRVPRWLVLERDIALRPALANSASAWALVLPDDAVPLVGLEAATTPSFPLRGARPAFRGVNLGLELALNAEAGKDDGVGFALSATPGFLLAFDDYRALLGRFYFQEGYLRIGYRRLELTFGRTALSFGNARHGNLLLSPATKPIDVLKLALRPTDTFMGQLALEVFLSGHTEAAGVPDSRLLGLGLSLMPWPWLELAVLELYQLGGRGTPSVDFSDLMKMLVYLDDPILDTKRQRSLVGHLSIWAPGRPFQIYGQALFDSLNGFSPLVGLWVPRLGVFDFRVEYVATSPDAYRHPVWTQGFAYKGTPVGHPIGPDGLAVYGDIGLLSLKEWRPSVTFAYEQRRRNPAAGQATEVRVGGGLDVARRWTVMDLSAGVRYFNVDGFRYQPGVPGSFFAAAAMLRYSFL